MRRSTSHISIHALREEGDVVDIHVAVVHNRISIHALREEGDAMAKGSVEDKFKFLSTPSARRATVQQAQALSE